MIIDHAVDAGGDDPGRAIHLALALARAEGAGSYLEAPPALTLFDGDTVWLIKPVEVFIQNHAASHSTRRTKDARGSVVSDISYLMQPHLHLEETDPNLVIDDVLADLRTGKHPDLVGFICEMHLSGTPWRALLAHLDDLDRLGKLIEERSERRQ